MSGLRDAADRPAIDRKLEREFRDTRPTKDLPCLVPGCAKKFRPNSDYQALLIHLAQKHPRVVIRECDQGLQPIGEAVDRIVVRARLTTNTKQET